MRPPIQTAASGRRSNAAGFTLAEAAITIAIVAIVITMVLQGLEGAKQSAAHTRYRKTAFELGVGMMGEIQAGLWMEEIESGMSGTFADLDEPDYAWEIALGEDILEEQGDDERPFDNYQARRDWSDDNESDAEEDDEESEEPFEKVKIRVTYPVLSDRPNTITLERWVPWDQVYGAEEEEEFGSEAQPEGAAAQNPGGNAQAGNGGGEGR